VKIMPQQVREIKQEIPVQRRVSRPAAPSRETAGVTTSLSSFATELRHAVRTEAPYGGVRPEVLEQVRRDLAAGTLGGDADMDRALNALLKELG
jgi:hypothetical protein